MNYIRNVILLLVTVLSAASCEKKDIIEYANGNPSMLVGNWIAFEFQGASFDGTVLEPYQIATALDPNRDSALIIDKIYNADIRVRTAISDTAFSTIMGEQLEKVGTNNYGIEYISIDGYVTTNPILIRWAYDLAESFFDDMMFYESDIEDVMLIRAGFYDSYQSIIDTVMILGYRKTGFEDISY
jgi:hypothetical protein